MNIGIEERPSCKRRTPCIYRYRGGCDILTGTEFKCGYCPFQRKDARSETRRDREVRQAKEKRWKAAREREARIHRGSSYMQYFAKYDSEGHLQGYGGR